jgi:hypothetical protein
MGAHKATSEASLYGFLRILPAAVNGASLKTVQRRGRRRRTLKGQALEPVKRRIGEPGHSCRTPWPYPCRTRTALPGSASAAKLGNPPTRGTDVGRHGRTHAELPEIKKDKWQSIGNYATDNFYNILKLS